MNLRQLEAFRATYMTGSVSRAAEVLHVSQPSVSRLIGDLEASIRFSLFVRTPRGLRPTAEAHRLFGAVERSFVGLREIRAVADAIRTLNSGEISLGVIPAFAYSVMPQAVALMHTSSPEIRFNVCVRRARVIVEEIETNRLDLGLISPAREYPNVATLFSSAVQYVCLLPASHSLASSETPIDLMALGEEEFVAFDSAYLEFICSDHELLEFMRNRSRLASHSAPVVAALAQATGAIAIVDPFTAAFMQSAGHVVSKPIKQEISYAVAIIGRDDLSVSARAFAAVLEETIKNSSASLSPLSGLAGALLR